MYLFFTILTCMAFTCCLLFFFYYCIFFITIYSKYYLRYKSIISLFPKTLNICYSIFGINMPNGIHGFYGLDSDVIYMHNIFYYRSISSFLLVICHEIGHWTGKENRLNRTFNNIGLSKAIENKNIPLIKISLKEEIIADLTSKYLLKHFGYNLKNKCFKSYKYVIKDVDPSVIPNFTISDYRECIIKAKQSKALVLNLPKGKPTIFYWM